MSKNKCFFLGSKYHMFYVLYPFVNYLQVSDELCENRIISSTESKGRHL
jgi:hypothetical protein